MPCYSPILGYRSRITNPSGKRSIVFNVTDGFVDLPVTLPCSRCIGCRLERSRQWAIRCVHEASLHPSNSFLTLTFDSEHLNKDGSLVKRDFQLFIKKLRKSLSPLKIRYFHCGEYGEKLGRPHHHACIFGYDFPDKTVYKVNNGLPLFISPALSALWGNGFASIGELNWETAAYTARYIMKKRLGDDAEDYYNGKIPPYNTMSRRPGIGAEWLTKYHKDVFPDDFIVIRGNTLCKPPKFYFDKVVDLEPKLMVPVKQRRREGSRKAHFDNSPDRLETKRECAEIRLKQLTRSYENED